MNLKEVVLYLNRATDVGHKHGHKGIRKGGIKRETGI